MAKFLKEVLNHTVTKKAADLGGYTPKSGDEEKFVKQHDIEVHTFTDPAIHNSAKKIKPVLTRPEEKRHKDAVKPSFKGASNGVTEAKETDTPACNNTAGGVSCPVHGIKECSTGTMKEEELDELSTDLLHRAAHKAAKMAMSDVQGRSGPIFKKRAAQANKFRAKGMEQEKKEKGSVKEESIDEVSKKTLGSYIQGASRDALSKQYALGKGEKTDTRKLMNRRKGIDKAADKLSKEEVELDEMGIRPMSRAYSRFKDVTSRKSLDTKNLKSYRQPGTPSKADLSKLADTAKNSGVEVKKLKPGKAKGIKEENIIDEDGPVAPVPPKHLDSHGIAKKFKSFVTAGGSTKTLGHYNTYVRLHAKKTGKHPDAINKEVRKHVKSMEESDTPMTFPNKTSDNALGQNI
jgi:hypothetical protein